MELGRDTLPIRSRGRTKPLSTMSASLRAGGSISLEVTSHESSFRSFTKYWPLRGGEDQETGLVLSLQKSSGTGRGGSRTGLPRKGAGL